MGVRRTVTQAAAAEAARRAAPLAAGSAVRGFLAKAIDGTGKWPGSRSVANRHLRATGSVEQAVQQSIEQHVRMAGVQGFLTSLGGIVVMPVTLPANLAGLAVLQLRMAAAIAHLRGYDIDDPRVRLACLASLLGEDGVQEMRRLRLLPGSPRELATGLAIEPATGDELIKQVSQSLAAQVAGKRVTVTVARRIPGLGGVVGASVDAVNTYKIGRYVAAELAPAILIERA